MVTFAGVLFVYGTYFLVLECVQLVSLGPGAYFDSFWNIVDIAAYVTTLVVCPCTVFRYGIGQGQFVPVLVGAGGSTASPMLLRRQWHGVPSIATGHGPAKPCGAHATDFPGCLRDKARPCSSPH